MSRTSSATRSRSDRAATRSDRGGTIRAANADLPSVPRAFRLPGPGGLRRERRGRGCLPAQEGGPPPISSQAAPAAPAGDEAAQGKELFLSYGCAVCHGEEGRGDGITSTATPVKPRDFHDRNAYKLGNTAEAISRTTQEGITTSGMPAYGHIPEDERLLIAKYVVSLQGQP